MGDFLIFHRNYELIIGDTLIKGVDVFFTIEKTLTREPNARELKIWNLNDRNRKNLRDQKRITVILKAGYEDSTGLLLKAICPKHSAFVKWITTIRSGDGRFQSTKTISQMV